MKKICHVVLCNPFNDGWSYQENLLSKYHKRLGYLVTIITTPYITDTKTNGYKYFRTGEYVNEEGIKIVRLPIIVSQKCQVMKVLRCYKGTYNTLVNEKPDIIFVHGGQFWDIREIIKYKKKNPLIKVFVDNHADYVNSARTWASYHIMHRIIWKRGIRKSIAYTEKFYGVAPARVDFLIKMYDVPKEKTSLLVMGADDDLVEKSRAKESIELNRKKYNILPDDFLIVSGGKIDRDKKNIINLLEFVKRYQEEHIKLIFFGPIIEELKEKLLQYVDGKKIQYVPWLDTSESYNLFAIANLAVFPGGHSVYWEQAAGCGVPLIVKYWKGITHVDLEGNCEFIHEDTYDELGDLLTPLISQEHKYMKMKEIAEAKGMEEFSYKNIAKRSIVAD